MERPLPPYHHHPLPQIHRDHSTTDTTRVLSPTYRLNETVKMTTVSYQGTPTVRLYSLKLKTRHFLLNWEHPQREVLLL